MLNKIQIALFMVIRNSKVLPVGLSKGKSLADINQMAYAAMQEILNGNLIDWSRAEKSYKEGEELFIKNVKNKGN